MSLGFGILILSGRNSRAKKNGPQAASSGSSIRNDISTAPEESLRARIAALEEMNHQLQRDLQGMEEEKNFHEYHARKAWRQVQEFQRPAGPSTGTSLSAPDVLRLVERLNAEILHCAEYISDRTRQEPTRNSENSELTPRPYTGSYRKLVVGFDIGTTFSGVSYSILEPGVVPLVQGVNLYVTPSLIPDMQFLG